MQKSLLVSSIVLSLCASCFNSNCRSQEALGDPRLEIVGSPGQTVAVSVRFFDNNEAVETVHSRTEIAATPEPEPLAFGHSGLRLLVVSAKREPVRVRLLNGDQEIARATTGDSGVVDLQQGAVPDNDDLEVPRAFLSMAEQQLIRSFLQAIGNADSRSIVSNIPIRNIDWQTLDAYFRTLKSELGPPETGSKAIDRWIGWEGSLGARVLSGSVGFESARCRFKLMVVEGKLVDVEPDCREMPIDWFDQKPEIDDFVMQSQALVRAIFDGDASRARTFFSRRYHEEVTVASLAELCQELREQFGVEIESLQLKQVNFQGMPAPSTSKLLSIDLLLVLTSGGRCIGRAEFVIPSGENTIGRAHLASINIRETWQSASPELADKLTQAAGLLSHENAGTKATEFLALFHPDLPAHIDSAKLTQFLEQAAKALGPLKGEPDFDLWSASTGVRVTAVGPASFSRAENVRVQASFADGYLVGLTVLTDDYAASTLDMILRTESVEKRGQEFWTAIFTGKPGVAHSLLESDFRAQLPLDDFRELIAKSELTNGPALSAMHVDVIRIADRDERVSPIMLVGYFIAEFDDGSYQPVSCEFRTHESGVDIVNLTADCHGVFPIESSQAATQFFDAVLGFDAQAVIDLVDATERELIDPAILQAFLNRLSDTLGGDVQTPQMVSLLREYTGDKQYLRVKSKLAPYDIPVEATFEFGHLETFYFQHPDMASFVENIQDASGIEAHATEFIKAWFSGDLTETSQYFVSSLRNESVAKRLTSVRNEFAVSLGDWIGCKMISTSPLAADNQLRLDMELEFRNGNRMLRLTYDINAYNGLISAVTFPK